MKSNLAQDVLNACSEISGKNELNKYNTILDNLLNKFNKIYTNNNTDNHVSEQLFNFLHYLRPNRYNIKSHLLTDLLDTYNSNKNDVKGANCTALTALYNILGEQLDIPLSTISPSNHILSRIEFSKPINVENTLKEGYDIRHVQIFKTHPTINLNTLKSKPNSFITAVTYFNEAENAYHQYDFDKSWDFLDKAQKLNSDPSFNRLRTTLMRNDY
jgi:hypothetical protein